MTILKSDKDKTRWAMIIVIISIIVNLLIAGIFIAYESQFTQTSETTTTVIEQDTEDGTGNNVYQAGENATYTQEGVTDNGQTKNN